MHWGNKIFNNAYGGVLSKTIHVVLVAKGSFDELCNPECPRDKSADLAGHGKTWMLFYCKHISADLCSVLPAIVMLKDTTSDINWWNNMML